MYTGWHQVAFSSEVNQTLTPVVVAGRRLMLIRTADGMDAFDATCPHRGANLAYGGTLSGEVVMCPFHGRRIRLGDEAGDAYAVRRYRTVVAAGAVFVLLSDVHENGLSALTEKLSETHAFFPGFTLTAGVAPEYIIENIFDADHFQTVHKLNRAPDLHLRTTDEGKLVVETSFETNRPNLWQGGQPEVPVVESRFFAHVFSPTVVVTELGDPGSAHVVITSATPVGDGSCVIRVSVGVAGDPKAPVTGFIARALIEGSRLAFEQDIAVWEHLDPDAPARLDQRDEPVVHFRRFCERFRAAAPG